MFAEKITDTTPAAKRSSGLGICTNKPQRPTHAVLSHLGLADWFGFVVGGDSTEKRKPDPEPLWAAVAGLEAERIVFVGDSEVDAQTAVYAKLPFALYTEGYRKTPVEDLYHDVAFDDFQALPDLVRSLLR